MAYTTLFSTLALASYLATSAYTLSRIKQAATSILGLPGLLLAITALASHAITVYSSVFTQQGINLGFFNVASLIFWLMAVFAIFAILRGKEIENLTVALYPLAALSIACATWLSSPYQPIDDWSTGLATHVIVSITSYGILTIAALQAISLALQEGALKRRRLRPLIRILPPLQTMEELLFEMLWLGVILLSASIFTGYLFIDDLFAQHLVHKTVFAICAWVTFCVLLWGRHQQGWRGKTAVKWTLGGFFILMLAYFGSKLVLELILQRV